MIYKVIDKYGPRRSFLAVLGSVWVLMGVSILIAEPPEFPMPGVPHTYVPAWIRFLLWAISGVVAVLASVWGEEDGDSKAQALGFVALYVMPAERTLSYFVAWVVSLGILPGGGLSRGWILALQYLAYVLIIYICAGWQDPKKEVDK